jgi:hypothetical protein
MLIPALFFVSLALFSFKERKAYPLIVLALFYAVLVPLLTLSGIFFISYHIAFTFTIPISILAGITLARFKPNKKMLKFLFLIGLVILFILINIRQHYITPMALQENELAPLSWLKDNTEKDVRVFYILYKRPIESKEYGVEHYEAGGIGPWTPSIAERIALPTWSSYSPVIEQFYLEFTYISIGIQNNSLSTEELESFFDKYKITHILLTYEEYSLYKSYFENYSKNYEGSGYVILKRP